MSAYNKEDFWQLRWPVLFLVLSIAAVIGIYLGLSELDTQADAQVRSARNDLNDAREAVDTIAEEEATITEYIDRYRQLVADNIVRDEDRLHLLERFAQIRSQFSLFPIRINIAQQTQQTLAYDADVDEPGRPISLRTSPVEISFPLLHEDDMARFFDALMASPGLLQARECSLGSDRATGETLIYLAQHFRAACDLVWYTFALPEEEPAAAQDGE